MRTTYFVNTSEKELSDAFKKQCTYNHYLCINHKNTITQLPISWKYKKNKLILDLLVGGGGKYTEIDAIIKTKKINEHKTKLILSINYHLGNLLIIAAISIVLIFVIIKMVFTIGSVGYQDIKNKEIQTMGIIVLFLFSINGGFGYILYLYGTRIKTHFEEILPIIQKQKET